MYRCLSVCNLYLCYTNTEPLFLSVHTLRALGCEFDKGAAYLNLLLMLKNVEDDFDNFFAGHESLVFFFFVFVSLIRMLYMRIVEFCEIELLSLGWFSSKYLLAMQYKFHKKGKSHPHDLIAIPSSISLSLTYNS